MKHPLLQDQLNCEIIGLLAVSKLQPLEKRLWLAVLPKMTEAEKKELKGNLEQEVDYEIKVSEKAIDEFVQALEKGI